MNHHERIRDGDRLDHDEAQDPDREEVEEPEAERPVLLVAEVDSLGAPTCLTLDSYPPPGRVNVQSVHSVAAFR